MTVENLMIGVIVVGILALLAALAAMNRANRIMDGTAAPGEKAVPAAAPPAKAPVPYNPAPAAQAGGQQIIAVISAAVAAMMSEQAPGVPYAITGVSRASATGVSRARGGERPAWGFAGMQQNTRPF